jgi:hypothetical protein
MSELAMGNVNSVIQYSFIIPEDDHLDTREYQKFDDFSQRSWKVETDVVTKAFFDQLRKRRQQ